MGEVHGQGYFLLLNHAIINMYVVFVMFLLL